MIDKQTYECVLTEDKHIMHEGKKIAEARVLRKKPGGRWYVSFWGDPYRYWANWVTIGQPFTAKRTNDSRYHGADFNRRNPGGFAARMRSAGREEARIGRRNGSPLY